MMHPFGRPNKYSDNFLELSSAVQNSELVEGDCDADEQRGQGRLAKHQSWNPSVKGAPALGIGFHD